MTPPTSTPAALGFRHCAEWEPHEATWIAWPHNLTDWPTKFSPIPWVYTEIVKKLTPGELVRIIVKSREHERSIRRLLARATVDLTNVQFFPWPTNRGWARDFGPIFVKNSEPTPEVAITAFQFTAWAKYPDWKHDAKIPERAGKALGLRRFIPECEGRRVVLEGGSIDANGTGTMLTTEECLLDDKVQARNPGMSRGEIERVFRDNFTVTNTVWLGLGIAGDDTHGHVDDLCRFVNRTTVVLCTEGNPADANYTALNENRERLQGARIEDGTKLTVVPLPMPAPVVFNGQRLPASYANFYISNAAVIVPTFNDPNDRIALGILSELFSDRRVVGIHAVDLVLGQGTLHCLTHEQPAAKP
jgi:agmatine deiminase